MVIWRLAPFIVALTWSASTQASEDIFAEIEEVYLAVFADRVHDHEQADRVLTVAMAIINDDRSPVPMPDRLWKRLKTTLEAKRVDVSKFVSADQIVWKKEESQFVDKVSGKEAWVYTISGIVWYGSDRLYVSEYMRHGELSGGGSTLELRKKSGTWTIVDRTEEWVAESTKWSRSPVSATGKERVESDGERAQRMENVVTKVVRHRRRGETVEEMK